MANVFTFAIRFFLIIWSRVCFSYYFSAWLDAKHWLSTLNYFVCLHIYTARTNNTSTSSCRLHCHSQFLAFFSLSNCTYLRCIRWYHSTHAISTMAVILWGVCTRISAYIWELQLQLLLPPMRNFTVSNFRLSFFDGSSRRNCDSISAHVWLTFIDISGNIVIKFESKIENCHFDYTCRAIYISAVDRHCAQNRLYIGIDK